MEKQYTYLMQSNREFKIGKSIDPEKRLQQIKTARPDVRLIAYGFGVSEKELHFKFKHQKIYREWFLLNKEDVEYIIKALNNECGNITITSYKKRSKIRIAFGKYKGIPICNMTSEKQIAYMRWFVNNVDKNKNKKHIRLFNWWLNELFKN